MADSQQLMGAVQKGSESSTKDESLHVNHGGHWNHEDLAAYWGRVHVSEETRRSTGGLEEPEQPGTRETNCWSRRELTFNKHVGLWQCPKSRRTRTQICLKPSESRWKVWRSDRHSACSTAVLHVAVAQPVLISTDRINHQPDEGSVWSWKHTSCCYEPIKWFLFLSCQTCSHTPEASAWTHTPEQSDELQQTRPDCGQILELRLKTDVQHVTVWMSLTVPSEGTLAEGPEAQTTKQQLFGGQEEVNDSCGVFLEELH